MSYIKAVLYDAAEDAVSQIPQGQGTKALYTDQEIEQAKLKVAGSIAARVGKGAIALADKAATKEKRSVPSTAEIETAARGTLSDALDSQA